MSNGLVSVAFFSRESHQFAEENLRTSCNRQGHLARLRSRCCPLHAATARQHLRDLQLHLLLNGRVVRARDRRQFPGVVRLVAESPVRARTTSESRAGLARCGDALRAAGIRVCVCARACFRTDSRPTSTSPDRSQPCRQHCTARTKQRKSRQMNGAARASTACHPTERIRGT